MKGITIIKNLSRTNEKRTARIFGFTARIIFCLALFIIAPQIISATTKIVYSRAYDFNNPGFEGLYTMNADGTNRVKVPNTQNGDQFPAVSPNGGKIVFTDGGGISVINIDGTNRMQIIADASARRPMFSPDGTKILYDTYYSSAYHIVLMNADGSNPVTFEDGNTINGGSYGASFSADGTKIAYTTRHAYGNNINDAIVVMNADGSNRVSYAENVQHGDSFPSFSPDGGKIVFQCFRNTGNGYTRGICTLNLSSGVVTVLGAAADAGAYPSYSPDGTKIVFYNRFASSPADVYNGIVMNSDGSNQTRLTSATSDQYPRWFSTPVTHGTLFDYTGDGKADLTAFRPSNSDWWAYDFTGTTEENRKKYLGNWGANGDIPISADYDGDGKMDLAIARPDSLADGYQIWIVQSSNNTLRPVDFYGKPSLNDIPVLNMDYDGDGRADFVVARYGQLPFGKIQWWIKKSSDNQTIVIPFGNGFDLSGPIDIPLTGDFDGDGRSDLVIWRYDENRQYKGWWVKLASNGAETYYGQFGISTDTTALADYDGDRKTDIAVYRPSDGVYWIRRSSDLGVSVYQLKTSAMTGNTRAVPADYDGDGKAEPAIYHEPTGTWRIYNPANGTITEQDWGFSTDILPAEGISPSSFFSRIQVK